MKHLVLCLSVLLLTLGRLAAEDLTKTTKLDVVYKTTEQGPLKLDLHYPSPPSAGSKFPLVLFTHGGGWVTGNKTIGDRGVRFMGVKALNEAGFCVASVDYRLCTKDGTITIRDCVTDAKDALRFLAKNADEFSINADRVFTWGDSAGGHLAQMLLLTPPDSFPGAPELADAKYRLVAGVSWYGPCDFEKTELFNGPGQTDVRDRFGGRIVKAGTDETKKLAAYREVSPVNYLKSDGPPLLMMQGDRDTTIPVHHAEYMKERADAVKAPVEVFIVKNSGHNWRADGGPLEPGLDVVVETTAKFLVDHLKSAPEFASPTPEVAHVPQNVEELWADFDPRKDPLEVEVIREWKEYGGVYRYVRYLIGTFKGKPARMAAFYGFPEGTEGKLPAVMHMHGGGQRAFLEEVKTYVDRGYAALSVNWGGREMENAEPGDPNTDWGAVDPTQQNVPGYFNLLPGDKFLVDQESPKNNNWYLLTLGCRRGLTFLEQQPEVDAERLGIFGHSMGGNLTMYVAGTDDRVKVAAPSVGGQGYRTEPHEMMGGKAQQENIHGDTALFTRTLGFENYAPRIHCPVLHLSGTNDFHGWMDDVYRTNALIPGQPLRYAFSPHLNHRFIPEVAVTRPLWLDHCLKGGPALPETPKAEWQLETEDGIPMMRVTPDTSSLPVARVDLYYSIDPDPRARLWRDAMAVRQGDTWEAKLPVLSTEEPLYAFANVYHTLPSAETLPHLPSITEVCLSSLLLSADSADLRAAGVKATDKTSLLIDDFSRGWHDWYRLNEKNPQFWQNWTRKITDPKWRGPDKARLSITLRMPETNTISIVLQENEWRSYRGKKTTYLCRREVSGSEAPQTISVSPADFKTSDGSVLANWSQIDQLGLCARFESADATQNGSSPWKGAAPEFIRLEWVPSP